MTISKAQEQTLKYDVIYPPAPVVPPPHGKLYMAFFRFSSFDNVAFSVI
jgi:hypothetical protein